MFKLTKILNSGSSIAEPFELHLEGETDIDIVANCIYHFVDRTLKSPIDVENPHFFIPINNYARDAKKVVGYFVSSDMIFSVPFIDNVGDACAGFDFLLRSSGENNICDAVEVINHELQGVGFVVYMSPTHNGDVLIKFKI